MPFQADIAVVVAQIVQAPAPVVCLDACVVLDIVRAPIRTQQQFVGSASRMTRAADPHRREAWIVLCDQAAEEIQHNRGKVLQITVAAIRDLAGQIACLNSAAQEAGAAERATDPTSLRIDAHLDRVVDELISVSHCLLEDATAVQGAFARARSKTVKKPARRGGEGLEDCVIVQHYLALAAALRQAGFGGRCLFTSSNTRDYATSATDKSLHADLAAEFSAVRMEYVPHLTRARYEAGLA